MIEQLKEWLKREIKISEQQIAEENDAFNKACMRCVIESHKMTLEKISELEKRIWK